jgi:hypothetical protein
MSSYSHDNSIGRSRAVQVIGDCSATGDLPRLVREIREAAAGDDGVSVGFLYALAESAAFGHAYRGASK